MPAGQQFSSTAVQMTLQGTINGAALAAVVDSVSGLPGVPFSVVADPGQGNQEIWDVTNVTGLTLTITRAVDGTTAQTHSAGAKIVHVGIGRDFREYRSHVDASTAVHGLGVGSAVVGTLDSQTLSNKTLTTPIVNGTGGLLTLPAGPDTLVGRATTDTLTNKTLTTPALTGPTTDTLVASGAVTSADLVVTGLTGAVVSSRAVGATAGGPPTTGTFLVGDTVIDTVNGISWICITGGTPGTWRPSGQAVLGEQVLGGTTATINFPSIPNYFKHLQLRVFGRSANAALDEIYMQFNADTSSSNYLRRSLNEVSQANGSNGVWAISGATTAQAPVGVLAASGGGGGQITADINGYSGTSFNKLWSSLSQAGPFSTGTHEAGMFFGYWNSVAAITSVLIGTISGSGFATGTTATLIGIG